MTAQLRDHAHQRTVRSEWRGVGGCELRRSEAEETEWPCSRLGSGPRTSGGRTGWAGGRLDARLQCSQISFLAFHNQSLFFGWSSYLSSEGTKEIRFSKEEVDPCCCSLINRDAFPAACGLCGKTHRSPDGKPCPRSQSLGIGPDPMTQQPCGLGVAV